MRDREKQEVPAAAQTIDGLALIAVLLILASILIGANSCSDSDITFPGDVPVLPTAVATATPA